MNLYYIFISFVSASSIFRVNASRAQSTEENFNGHIAHILEVVKGGVTNIPCNISLHTSSDKVQTVIWYKEEIIHSQTPIYTFDVRDKTLEKGEHWSDELVLAGRGYFRYQDDPPKLVIIDVQEKDAGTYQCRVDFLFGPTQYSKAKVIVIVPPEKIIIADGQGNHINHYVVGPFNEGELVNMTCIAVGGHPQPNITWWKENTLLDNTIDAVAKRKVKNTLFLQPLERKDLHTVLTCQASNNNKGLPISTSITIEMNLRPLWAKMHQKLKVLTEGNAYELCCDVVGSRPRALITWWLEGVQLTDTRELTFVSNDSVTSYMTFVPTLDDHRKRIFCRAVHPFISNSLVEEEWRLNVQDAPPHILIFDSGINKNDIREGMDVKINCEIKSNLLSDNNIMFQQNDEKLYHNPLLGVIILNNTLILEKVDRSKSGNYSCTANYLEGAIKSNLVTLDVKYAPVCKPGQIKVHRVDLHYPLEIPCELEANPPQVEFSWKLKYNDGSSVKLSDHLVTTQNTSSIVQYSPTSEDDYPTIICTGSNEIGVQEEPCVFYLISQDSPDALSNCKVTKQTESSLNVECIDEFNRGIRGEFIMEVYDAQTGKLVQNVTSLDPTFSVIGLESGIGFDVDLYVVKNEHKSLVTHLQTFTLTYGNLTGHSGSFISIYKLLFLLAGIVGSLIFLAILIVIVVRYRGNSEFTEEANCNGFEGSSGCYMPVGSDKFNKQTGSNTSYDSFDTDTHPDIMT